ncbi:hypothetical protein [Myxococcus sp. RHSTA-1-4]|uniref:hypothetical protein n=1 Tax=Myxococcus sp. RHSTA-1-4 TaxID=2874601 RepID=UPI001CBB1D9C|nr:hypothetical protein [Myxococcus sp. RHSTA-1-4]MBZ4416036.1 hypothetical protein [Myxococcus sp. RHSTA-1-4]
MRNGKAPWRMFSSARPSRVRARQAALSGAHAAEDSMTVLSRVWLEGGHQASTFELHGLLPCAGQAQGHGVDRVAR